MCIYLFLDTSKIYSFVRSFFYYFFPFVRLLFFYVNNKNLDKGIMVTWYTQNSEKILLCLTKDEMVLFHVKVLDCFFFRTYSSPLLLMVFNGFWKLESCRVFIKQRLNRSTQCWQEWIETSNILSMFSLLTASRSQPLLGIYIKNLKIWFLNSWLDF